MAKKKNTGKGSSQTYMKGSITTPKCQAIWPSLAELNETSKKYEISTLIETDGDGNPTGEWKAVIDQLIEFQNDCLEANGLAPRDELMCLKDVVSYNESEEEWEATGDKRIIFKSGSADKFTVVGPNPKVDIDPEQVSGGSTGGDIVRVNGNAAFGFFGKEPYVTLYIKAVQRISGTGPSGSSAFDNEEEDGGDNAPFDTEEGGVDHGQVELA